jgi:YD repeat-containing protein
VTSYEYDAAGRETEEIDPAPSSLAPGPSTLFSYDTAGNLYSEADPDGNVTTYAYDALGRETSQTNSLDESTCYIYDGDSNVVKTTDPDDQVITDAYNDLGQLTQENWYTSPSESDETNAITYTYDNLGDMLTAADDFSSYAFAYNALGQQTSVDNNGSGPDGDTGTAGVPDVLLASN